MCTITRNILQDIRQQWSSRQPSSALVSPAAAVGALGELSPGGALMRGFQEQSLGRKYANNALVTLFYTLICRSSTSTHRKRI